MPFTEDVRVVTRRFLQSRRRGPLDEREITRLLTPDAEYVHVVGDISWNVVGASAIAKLLVRQWAGMAPTARMSVIRHAVLEDGTATGHWRREEDGTVVNGRDTYELRDGLISRIVAEEFPDVRVPEAVKLGR